jgi:LacI family transcriptional regulator
MRAAVEAAGHRLAVFHFSANNDELSPMSFQRFPIPGLASWLRSLPRPVGVLTPCDHWAVEVLQVCHDLGLRVPEDVAVLGVDDDEFFCRMARPALSSIILSGEAIGRLTAELIESRLDKGNKRKQPAVELLVPPVGIATRRSTDVLAIENPFVVAAIRFIRDNHSGPIDVSDVLKEVPVSRRWLERRVRDAIGITLGDEIRRARIERAKRLLIDTKHSIADVAKHSGFTDIRHIENSFRNQLGVTPREFRRRATGAP